MRALLEQYPRMPATVLAERDGWSGGHSWFSEYMARIRPEYAPADPNGTIPAQALAADRAAMAGLPPMAPTVGTTTTTRLGRDYYVSTGGNAYSVHPEAIGRMITVTTSLERVTACCGDRMVADHQRLWGTNGLVRDFEHVAAAAVLREQFAHRPTRAATARSTSRSPTWLPMTRCSGPGRSPDGPTKRSPVPGEADKLIAHQARLLKAPRIAAHYHRLAEQGREAHWSLEDYLGAVLTVESNARAESGARQRIRYAGFPAIKTITDFDFTAQPVWIVPRSGRGGGQGERRTGTGLSPCMFRQRRRATRLSFFGLLAQRPKNAHIMAMTQTPKLTRPR